MHRLWLDIRPTRRYRMHSVHTTEGTHVVSFKDVTAVLQWLLSHDERDLVIDLRDGREIELKITSVRRLPPDVASLDLDP